MKRAKLRKKTKSERLMEEAAYRCRNPKPEPPRAVPEREQSIADQGLSYSYPGITRR